MRTMTWLTPLSMAVICPPMEVKRSLTSLTVAAGGKADLQLGSGDPHTGGDLGDLGISYRVVAAVVHHGRGGRSVRGSREEVVGYCWTRGNRDRCLALLLDVDACLGGLGDDGARRDKAVAGKGGFLLDLEEGRSHGCLGISLGHADD